MRAIYHASPKIEIRFSKPSFDVDESAGVAEITLLRFLTDSREVFSFATLEGTAVEGFDFRGVLADVVFDAGVESVSVPVTVFDNFWNDGQRTVSLTVADKIGSSRASALLTIHDNEDAVDGVVNAGASTEDTDPNNAYLRLFRRASVLATSTVEPTTTAVATTTAPPTTTTGAPCSIGCDGVCREVPYVPDDCDVCGPPLVNQTSPARDCAGVCFGTAHENVCGVCVGGSTRLPVTTGLDACGVCFGDNSTCTDCAGVVHGNATEDVCGVCNGDASSCTRFTDVIPNSGPESPSVVTIHGAGFRDAEGNVRNVRCIVTDMNGGSVGAVVSSPSVAACPLSTFSSSGVKQFSITIEGAPLGPLQYVVIPGQLPALDDITYKAYINTAGQHLTVAGSNFFDPTPLDLEDLKGYAPIVCKHTFGSEVMYTNGTYINATSVDCALPTIPLKSRAGTLAVSFTAFDGVYTNAVNVEYWQFRPTILTARFSNSAARITVLYNTTVAVDGVPGYGQNGSVCNIFFPTTTVALFGLNPTCTFLSGSLMSISLVRTF
mgnify:CR=1 FL=1